MVIFRCQLWFFPRQALFEWVGVEIVNVLSCGVFVEKDVKGNYDVANSGFEWSDYVRMLAHAGVPGYKKPKSRKTWRD